MGIETPKNRTFGSLIEKDPIAFGNLVREALEFYENKKGRGHECSTRSAANDILNNYRKYYASLSQKEWCILRDEIAREVGKAKKETSFSSKPPTKDHRPAQLDLFE